MDKHYRQFLVIAEHGSISSAAEQLNLSQPTLTNNMKKLEKNLDVILFTRRSKGVDLTEYGKLLHEQLQELSRRHDTMLDKLADLKARKTEKIKMGTGDAWWEVFVKSALQRYCEQHPGISIQLEFGNHLKLMDMLVHGHIDLFIGHEIHGLSRRCNVQFTPILQDQEAQFVHRSHPLLLSGNPGDNSHMYPLLQVTPDQDSYQHLIENPQPKQQEKERKKLSERITYEINSLSASLDLLTTSKAVMPYTKSMANYFEQFDIVPLPSTSAPQTGIVGIYHLNEPNASHITDIKEILSRSQ
ncbi:LysR family transcriptional regulator [Photobacterium lutimaris]|uniref:LysR family transcriptional regulator n=1 Tax=Photobacterium lutimaris TaxID=388278 RepID=A0A2T3IZ82_9GAMM|nr:LysR family transcriptional regulator [Photobacterium lutimaris]PSU33959.1 LysR family transcriptional regulator [Photobacterium lutimaris]TDR76294.1 DNA-binding transcriptional LysR family regulator [Photobacterium lutimaris]